MIRVNRACNVADLEWWEVYHLCPRNNMPVYQDWAFDFLEIIIYDKFL